MRRISVLALTLAVFIEWGVRSKAFGIAQFYTQPETTTSAPGTRFTLLINLRDNVDEVDTWQYVLTWNPSLLRCDSLINGPYLSRNGQYPTTFTWDISQPGQAFAFESLLHLYPHATGDGNLARMVFSVLAAGASALHFDPANCFLYLYNPIPLTLRDGYFRSSSSGVQERTGQGAAKGRGFKASPNPFTSFAIIPGHEQECFALYDISGRKVGTYQGDRIGEGLAPGVYFLKPEGENPKPLRVVKVR